MELVVVVTKELHQLTLETVVVVEVVVTLEPYNQVVLQELMDTLVVMDRITQVPLNVVVVAVVQPQLVVMVVAVALMVMVVQHLQILLRVLQLIMLVEQVVETMEVEMSL